MFGQAMKVPKDFQDYDDDDPNIEKRKNRYKYWENLIMLKHAFRDETGKTDHREYLAWLENKYGIRPIETHEGMLTDDFTITDESKFIVYVLKYGK